VNCKILRDVYGNYNFTIIVIDVLKLVGVTNSLSVNKSSFY
jgi:hypothetical protein